MLGASASGNSLSLNFGISNKGAKHEEEEPEKQEKEMEEGGMKDIDLTMMLPFIRQMMLQDTSESGVVLAGAIRLSDQYRPGLDELRGKRLIEIFELSPKYLAQWGFDAAPLEHFKKRVLSGRTPADDLIDLYQANNGSMASVLAARSQFQFLEGKLN